MFEHGYALLIGVDQNKVPRFALPTIKNDVTKLNEIITHPERCGYLRDNVRLLTGTDATREKILDGLDWLRTKLEADTDTNQTVFIYFSGHGHRETSGEPFLIPYDLRFPIRLGSLNANDFAEGINNLKPRRLLVVLDCCHAESMNVKDTAQSSLTSTAVTPDTLGIDLLADGDGRAVLSSSRGSQESFIRLDGQMSVFTYHLVEALTGHAGRPAWPNVTVTEVMEYVGRAVPVTVLKEQSVEQEPVFDFSGTAFPIALVLGGKGVENAAAAPDPLAELPIVVRSTLTVDEVAGEATNVAIDEMHAGKVDADTTAKKVEKDGKLISVKIGTLGYKK
jgi:hypothetical protein